MEKPIIGSVVAVEFPFSDLSNTKLRPALIVGLSEYDNLILCQITSKSYSSKSALVLEEKDFIKGKLPTSSYIRPDKLFTADKVIVHKNIGTITERKLKDVKTALKLVFEI